MRAEFKNDSLVIVPETDSEIEQFNRLFPERFMRNSKHINVRQFVDMFGNPEANRPYLLLNGYDPSEESVKRPRVLKSKDDVQSQAV